MGRMLPPEHLDHDPEKLADSWHTLLPCRQVYQLHGVWDFLTHILTNVYYFPAHE